MPPTPDVCMVIGRPSSRALVHSIFARSGLIVPRVPALALSTLREQIDDPDPMWVVIDRLTDKLEYAERDAVRARLLGLRAVAEKRAPVFRPA